MSVWPWLAAEVPVSGEGVTPLAQIHCGKPRRPRAPAAHVHPLKLIDDKRLFD
jgi:hypothetical protein